ncbi:hypothetical protein Tco_1007456 [Tanacetum coccineum]
MVNENNSDIISDIPNMDQVRDKEEHDDVDDEQQRAFFASLINNLKCDVEKYTKINREDQQENALLTKELERYKEKEKHFTKETTIESRYCKKINLLNDEISNLKSQACQNDKTFARENRTFNEQYLNLNVSKQNPPREDVFINSSFEDNVKRIARNPLSEEFEPLVKDVNLQLTCFENGLVKEMKYDLKYVTSLEDEFDETCLILDIQ